MKRKKGTILTIVALLAVLLASAGSTGAQSGAPTVVSYQGQVTVGGTPYDGTGHFKFAVVNAAGDTTYWSNDGTAAGEPATAVALTVSNGLFNVLLGDTALANMTALPATAFDGTERYLRVWFMEDGGSAFTQLSPDRRIAAVPYALQAEEAKNAATAGDADTVDGQHASAFQQHYANVVVVAKSGGDYDTITAALNSITDASDTNRYLVRVMPGVYSEQVTMKPYVDIEGSGELTTRITFTGSTSLSAGTVIGADETELRFLTVANTGGDTHATAICTSSASPRLTHVTANASGGTTANIGVYNVLSSPAMTNVTASASGGTINHGVYNLGSSPAMMNVTASASGGNISYGVRNAVSSPTMTNVTASASGAGANHGVYNQSSSPTIQNSSIHAADGGSYGISNVSGSGSYTVRVDNSQVTGGTATIDSDSGFTVLVGATLLDGGAVAPNGGTITCAGVYDEAYVFYPSSCP